MGVLTVINPGHLVGIPGGIAACAVSANSGGDQFPNAGGSTVLWLRNLNGANVTVTFQFNANSTIDGCTPANWTAVMTNGIDQLYGPWKSSIYANANDYMGINYSNVTGITVAPILFGQS